MADSARFRSFVFPALLLSGFLLAACTPATQGPAAQQESMPPDTIVARVNDEDIVYRDLEIPFEQALQMAMLQGQDTGDEAVRAQIRTEVLEQLVAAVLLRQEAERSGLTVSDERVEEEYQNIVMQMGGEETLRIQLEEVGFSEEDLRNDLRRQLLIQEFIEQRFAAENMNVSDAEVRDTYEELQMQYEDLPPLEEIEDLLREEVIHQREQEIVEQLILRLRAEAQVEILL